MKKKILAFSLKKESNQVLFIFLQSNSKNKIIKMITVIYSHQSLIANPK